MSIRSASIFVILCLASGSAPFAADALSSAEYATRSDIAYYDEKALASGDDYQKERCKLDLYYPTGQQGYATVVWFHGGGLTQGQRYFPDLKEQGIALVAVDYRLAPRGGVPSFLEDSAAATAWVLRNITQYGGDPTKVFVAGHSAGAYLAAMIALDPRWLVAQQASNRQLAGVIAVSGQMTTHFTVKKLRGDAGPPLRPIIDEYAPLYHASKDLPPISLIVGGRAIEFQSRVEENQLLAVSLRNLGHARVEFHEMGGLDHDTVEQGAMIVMREFIQSVLRARSVTK